MNDDIIIFKQLDELKDQHRQLDEEIRQLQLAGNSDEMQVARLKKRKLQLRDQIMTLEVEIYPDQPA
ncbi:MAG: YdcH family protein [Rickettsiales bacterium]